MEEEKKGRGKDGLTILLLIALIILLIVGVNSIFGMLARRYPYLMQGDRSSSASQSVMAGESGSQSAAASPEAADGEEEAPRFCPSCGKQLREGFQWGQFCPYCGEQVT